MSGILDPRNLPFRSSGLRSFVLLRMHLYTPWRGAGRLVGIMDTFFFPDVDECLIWYMKNRRPDLGPLKFMVKFKNKLMALAAQFSNWYSKEEEDIAFYIHIHIHNGRVAQKGQQWQRRCQEISLKKPSCRKFHLELFMPGNLGLTNHEIFESWGVSRK